MDIGIGNDLLLYGITAKYVTFQMFNLRIGKISVYEPSEIFSCEV